MNSSALVTSVPTASVACYATFKTPFAGRLLAGCVRWLDFCLSDCPVSSVYPTLFGGEPLLDPALLFEVMDRTMSVIRCRGIDGGFSCSSNGTLLTPVLASEMARRGLHHIQISIDGSAASHDRRRFGKLGEPTFDHAFRGLMAAVGRVPLVTMKVNVDRDNRDDVPRLFDEVVARGLQDQVEVKLEAVAGQIGVPGASRYPSACIPPDSVELAHTYEGLKAAAGARGIRVSRDTGHVTPCMFSTHHGVAIDAAGDIFKCVSLIGRPEYRVGSVLEPLFYTAAYTRQMNAIKVCDLCLEEKCPYTPVCAGGCAYEAILRAGQYAERFCARPFIAEDVFARNLAAMAREPLGVGGLASSDLCARPPAAATRDGHGN